MKSDFIIFPFLIGVLYLLGVVVFRFSIWIMGLSRIDKIRLWKGLRSSKTLHSIWESFMEGLLHRKVFRKNPFLGYMHMSLAFGWFLLIFIGHLEVIAWAGSLSFPFYYPVFFRYFVTDEGHFFFSGTFSFIMDLLLLFVLSGVSLAYFKRFRSRIFGMRKTTQLKWGDQLALSSLWLIFPLRLLSESITAGIYDNGNFLTQSIGNALDSWLPLPAIELGVWTAYSCSLGLFFIALPLSRYMHIPAEILFIFLRNYGIKLKKRENTYSRVQVFSCSRCGICLDTCQLNDADIRTTQSVYVLKNIRNKNLTDELLFNCLLCGRCQQVCPVGIELNDLRITQRIESTRQYNSQYDYLKETGSKQADVVYFAGCMTHLTPGIKKSMTQILDYAGINFWFMDEDKAPCCGRPLMQAGQYDAARKLIENNENHINRSGAKILLTSCPICYKVFKEDYSLPKIKVKHHSEYILELVKAGKIPTEKSNLKIVYHDPCELGRGSKIYNQPRELLRKYARLIRTKEEKENSPCCGGSLANIKIQMSERDQIRDKALQEFARYNPDILAVSCPLCKKTFSKGRDLAIKDISEIVAMQIKDY